MSALQELYGGRLKNSWLSCLSRRSLSFEHDGSSARLTIESGKHTNWIRLALDWPDQDHQLSIVPAGVRRRLENWIGLKHIQVSRPIFDDA